MAENDMPDVDNQNILIVEEALLRLARGFECQEVIYEDKIGRNGDVIPTCKTIKKHIAPDLKAIEFFLINRASDKWQKTPEGITFDVKGMAKLLKNLSDDEISVIINELQE